MARIPAHEIEKTVTDTIRTGLLEALALDKEEDYKTIEYINAHALPAEQLARTCLDKVIVYQDMLDIDINIEKLRHHLDEHLNLTIPVRTAEKLLHLSVPFTIRRANKGAIIIKPETGDYDPFDLPPTQLKNLVRGVIWRDEHFSGTSIRQIAKRENLSEAGVRKIIMGSFDTLMAM